MIAKRLWLFFNPLLVRGSAKLYKDKNTGREGVNYIFSLDLVDTDLEAKSIVQRISCSDKEFLTKMLEKAFEITPGIKILESAIDDLLLQDFLEMFTGDFSFYVDRELESINIDREPEVIEVEVSVGRTKIKVFKYCCEKLSWKMLKLCKGCCYIIEIEDFNRANKYFDSCCSLCGKDNWVDLIRFVAVKFKDSVTTA